MLLLATLRYIPEKPLSYLVYLFFCSAEEFDKRQREGEKLECIIFSITLPAMIASTLAIKKF